MLGVEHEREVEHLGLKVGEVAVGPGHMQDVLGGRDVRARRVDDEAPSEELHRVGLERVDRAEGHGAALGPDAVDLRERGQEVGDGLLGGVLPGAVDVLVLLSALGLMLGMRHLYLKVVRQAEALL